MELMSEGHFWASVHGNISMGFSMFFVKCLFAGTCQYRMKVEWLIVNDQGTLRNYNIECLFAETQILSHNLDTKSTNTF